VRALGARGATISRLRRDAQTPRPLRLPAALPFVFTAPEGTAPLGLIGATVAAFFGSPADGMGFRITAEAATLSRSTWAGRRSWSPPRRARAPTASSPLAERAAAVWRPSLRA
jgi:NitT/TauT family transport system permease protein